MTALEAEISETLKALEPSRARALEAAIHNLLVVVRPEKIAPPEVDANGWPIGYWESVVGCLDEDDDWQPPADPPPEPVPH